MLQASGLFNLEETPYNELFAGTEYVWEALPRIKSYLKEHLNSNVGKVRRGEMVINKTFVLYKGETLSSGFAIDTSGKKPLVIKDGVTMEGASIIFSGAILMDDQIQIGEGTVIEPTALIKGPTIIGDRTEVRHGAYIRGETMVGNDCIVGHTTEIKSSVMLGGSKAGHFAYIGDSILGKVNLGAGTKLANVKMGDTPIVLRVAGTFYETGLRKFGAVIADGVETGCNSVTAPGTIIGKNSLLYPGGTARGCYPSETVIKFKPKQEFIERNREES
ncbi:MAG: glucose-1-phosphate thymidylyltransferase [Bacillota bacterium]